MMGNIIVIAVLAALVVLAVVRASKHFSGGGCCGSGSTTIRSHKKLTGPKLGQRVLTVQGMHCKNCQARVENAIDRLDGVVCKVDLHKKTATISYSVPVEEQVLIDTIEKLGYQVTKVR